MITLYLRVSALCYSKRSRLPPLYSLLLAAVLYDLSSCFPCFYAPQARYSVCKVSETTSYDANGVPIHNGLMDARMGTTDYSMKCSTCDLDKDNCPGHFGHIELAAPVLHTGFLSIIYNVLRCVCFHCSKLLVSENCARGKGLARYVSETTDIYMISRYIRFIVCHSSIIIIDLVLLLKITPLYGEM